MAEFAEYYVELLWMILQNIWFFIRDIGLALYHFFIYAWYDFFTLAVKYVSQFDAFGWILFILITMLNLSLLFFICYRIFQLLRRYIFFRAKEVEKDKLMEQITKLQMQAEELMKEKQQIFALKVNGDIRGNSGIQTLGTDNALNELAVTENNKNESDNHSRFVKLSNLDAKYEKSPNYVSMTEKDLLSLREIVDRFMNFAASQLHLYYNRQTVMQYFAGLATSKIIILEGISGTGKTSLPYAMGKFFNNETSICSVQPSWRDRGELIGYYNDFTKKFNETDFLSALYEQTLREDNKFIVLDEMNLARIEYYFADFLSILEMPDVAEWKIDIVAEPLKSDPKNIIYGKLLVPQNVWFVGTANNDDSTFTITDKVYDRAVALSLNQRAAYFDAPVTDSYNCTYKYLNDLFQEGLQHNKISDSNMQILMDLDEFIQSKFKIAFGNRIMKQIKLFVPVYMECGGDETEALDFMLCTKILRKFNALNLPFLMKELTELTSVLNKKFGKDKCKMSLAFIEELKKNH